MRLIVNAPPHVYGGCGLDRAAEKRRDAAWLQARRTDPLTRVLPMASLRVLIAGEEATPLVLVPTLSDLPHPLPDDAVFLGMDGEVAYFTMETPESAFAHGRFVDLRSIGTILPAREAGMLAYGRALMHWHGRNRFCANCGALTAPIQGGHARRCDACDTEHFPRTDAAVIVLITHGEHCLLGRSARFPEGMYSTLAGFVEAAESLEQALHREVFEEAGVTLTGVTYRSSQPWPFPQSLMIGFRAEARDLTLNIDKDEIEDALWIERAVLADPERCPVRLPGHDSIARFLLDEWLAEAG